MWNKWLRYTLRRSIQKVKLTHCPILAKLVEDLDSNFRLTFDQLCGTTTTKFVPFINQSCPGNNIQEILKNIDGVWLRIFALKLIGMKDNSTVSAISENRFNLVFFHVTPVQPVH